MSESVYSDQHTFESFLSLETAHSSPVIVESLDVLRYAGIYFVRSTSQDGTVGIATCNSRAAYLVPMLKHLVIPAFIGRDARELEWLVKEVYTYRNNYKFHGMPFWCCVAYVEASLFDLLGKVAGKSVGELLGGPWRDEIPIYLSSSRRDTTPEEEEEEEEVAQIAQRLEKTKARAVKLKIGERMRYNADSMPGRTEQLIPP
jgi:L-alanine-DL-glutamate epimerase-like enolase superfamily enzyme